ncbi:hypothetical protein OIU34_24100 [Pararhizobium sp. BT-229]|uniref:hypothetical protein n=1 Tax=Pararhizobium sp. BT-229 TaxID=2986923 RepID=UPI0021F7A758|nr:hypothetical protein [Pararhizobium sp. BT-229]MCV9964982.1 hypothetical protein [Pararhizobium sp. BT-229]
MSDFITLGILKLDGSFASTLTRREFLQPRMLNPAFLNGDMSPIFRLLPDEGSRGWHNQPSEDGYVLIDSIEKKVFAWHDGAPLTEIEAKHLGFGRNAERYGPKLRESLRPFIVAAEYVGWDSMESVRHEFDPCRTDRELKGLMNKIAYEGLRKSLFFKPALCNLVSYEVAAPGWEFTTLPFRDPKGLQRINHEVEARVELSERDAEAWAEAMSAMTETSSLPEAWHAIETLLSPKPPQA